MATASYAARPLPRAYHAALFSAQREQLFVWGGLDEKKQKSSLLTSGVDIFNTSKELWERKRVKGTAPPGCAAGAYTLLGESLYYFGGRRSLTDQTGRFDNFIRRLNLAENDLKWERIRAENPAKAPKGKCGSGMVTCGKDRIAVFAGVAKAPEFTNDVDVFSVVERTWRHQPTTGDVPPPCDEFTFNQLDPTHAILYGGLTNGDDLHALLQETFILDLSTWHWSKLKITGDKPEARWGHVACVVYVSSLQGEQRPLLLIMGGTNSEGDDLDDMWILDISSGIWKEIPLPKEVRECLSWGVSANVVCSGPASFQILLFGGHSVSADGKHSFSGKTTLVNFEMKGMVWYVSVIADDHLGGPERLSDEKLRVKAAEVSVSSLERKVAVLEEQNMRAEEKGRMAEEFEIKLRETEESLQQSKQREMEERKAKQKAERKIQALIDTVVKDLEENESFSHDPNVKQRAQREILALRIASNIREAERKGTEAKQESEITPAEPGKQWSTAEDRATGTTASLTNQESQAEQEEAESMGNKVEAATIEKRAPSTEAQGSILQDTLTRSGAVKDEATKYTEEVEEKARTAIKWLEDLVSCIQAREKRLEAEREAQTQRVRIAEEVQRVSERSLPDLEDQLAAKETEIREVTLRVNLLEKTELELQEEVHQLECKQQEADLRLQEERKQITALESKAAEAKKIADEYKIKAKEAEITAQRAEEARQSLEVAMANAAEESKRNIQEKKQTIQALNKELSETKGTAAEECERAELLTTKVQELEGQNHKLEKEVQILQGTMTDVAERIKKRADELEEQLQESEQRLRESESKRKTEFEKGKQRLQEAENRMQSLQESLEEESGVVREREEEIRALKKAHSDEKETTNRTIKELAEKLQEAEESLTQTRATTAQELSQAEREIEDLKAAMAITGEQAACRIKELTKECETLKEEFAKAQTEAELSLVVIRDTESKLGKASEQLQCLKNELINFEEKLENANIEIEELKETLEEEREQMREEVQTLGDEMRELQVDTQSNLGKAKAEIQSLKNELINSEELMENANIEIEELTVTLEDEREQMEKELQALSDKIRGLQERVQEAYDEIKNLRDKLVQAGERAETQEAITQETEAKLIQAQTDIQTLKEAIHISETRNQEAAKAMDVSRQTLAMTEEGHKAAKDMQDNREEAMTEVQHLTESTPIAVSGADNRIEEPDTLANRLKENLRTTEETQAMESKRAENAEVAAMEQPHTQAYPQLQAGNEEESREAHEIVRTADMKTTEYLRGMEVIAGTRFVTKGRDPQTFEWENHGLKISIPELSDRAEIVIDIKAGLAGQFELPVGVQLVSPVYWLCCRQKFEHPVTLEMQHCAVIRNQTECSSLQFVAAKCSQEVLPYLFKPLQHGTFSRHSSFGSIELKQFSFFAITDSSISLRKKYFTRLYYIVKGANKWEIHFIMSWNLQLCIEAVRSEYSGSAVEPGPHMLVQFEKKEISLDIPKGGITKNGWNITPLFPPVITKEQVDEFIPGQRIPSCQFLVKWVADGSPEEWNSALTLHGAEKPYDYLTISLPPVAKDPFMRKRPMAGDVQERDIDQYKKKRTMVGDAQEADEGPQLKHLVVMGVTNWYNLGLQLDLEVNSLDEIKSNNRGNIDDCRREMFRTWLNTQTNASYKLLVKALVAIGEKKQAKQLCDKYGIKPETVE